MARKSSGRNRRRLYTASEMRRVLSRKGREGMTFGELCEQSGIPVSTLQWWQKRLREGDPPLGPAAEPGVEFVEARWSARPPGAYEVVLRSGRQLRIEGRVDVESIRALVRVLEEPC